MLQFEIKKQNKYLPVVRSIRAWLLPIYLSINKLHFFEFTGKKKINHNDGNIRPKFGICTVCDTRSSTAGNRRVS